LDSFFLCNFCDFPVLPTTNRVFHIDQTDVIPAKPEPKARAIAGSSSTAEQTAHPSFAPSDNAAFGHPSLIAEGPVR
jgi:hypothetical protein